MKMDLVEQLRFVERAGPVAPDGHPGLAQQAADEIERLRREIDYLYRCVASGYNQGVFDFSILKDRALDHVRRADAGGRKLEINDASR